MCPAIIVTLDCFYSTTLLHKILIFFFLVDLSLLNGMLLKRIKRSCDKKNEQAELPERADCRELLDKRRGARAESGFGGSESSSRRGDRDGSPPPKSGDVSPTVQLSVSGRLSSLLPNITLPRETVRRGAKKIPLLEDPPHGRIGEFPSGSIKHEIGHSRGPPRRSRSPHFKESDYWEETSSGRRSRSSIKRFRSPSMRSRSPLINSRSPEFVRGSHFESRSPMHKPSDGHGPSSGSRGRQNSYGVSVAPKRSLSSATLSRKHSSPERLVTIIPSVHHFSSDRSSHMSPDRSRQERTGSISNPDMSIRYMSTTSPDGRRPLSPGEHPYDSPRRRHASPDRRKLSRVLPSSRIRLRSPDGEQEESYRRVRAREVMVLYQIG